MLNEFLLTKIDKVDCATCHTAEAALDVLRPVFEAISVAELMSFGHLGAAI